MIYYFGLSCCNKNNRMKVMERGNEVLDKEMDVLDLLNTVRQIKTYI